MRYGICFIFCALLCGCGSSVPADIRASDPTVRIPAIEQAARRRDIGSERQMVRDLASEDSAVRFYAIQGLYRLTGNTLGYHYYDDEAARAAAIEKWKNWLHDRAAAAGDATREVAEF